MDLISAGALAKQLLEQHGLSQQQWTFSWNRGKKVLGLCRFTEKRIELSVHFVIRHNEAMVRDTLLHEIAHALAGAKAGHGPKWRLKCVQIGAEPQRLAYNTNMPAGNWRAICPCCAIIYDRHRKPPARARYYCPKCGAINGSLHFTRMFHAENNTCALENKAETPSDS